MDNEKTTASGQVSEIVHSKGIREHTDGREFRPYLLLGVTLLVAAVLAVICYAIQFYFIGPG